MLRRAGVDCFEADGYRVVCVPDGRELITRHLLPDPAGAVARGRLLRENNYRITARVSVDGFGAILLKVHRLPRGLSALRQRIRGTRARAEWDASRWLHAVGLPVSEPLGMGERRDGRQSFFVARFEDNAPPFLEALAAAPWSRRRSLLQRSAALVRALHAQGFDHRDLHAGNVLVPPDGGEASRLLVVDLHRAGRGRPLRARARHRAAARWLHSLGPLLGPGGRLRWLADYLGEEASSPRARQLMRAVDGHIRTLEGIRRRSRSRRCWTESTVYTRVREAGFSGYRRRALAPERLLEAAEAHEAALAAADGRVAKNSPKSRVTCHGDLVVKESRPTTLWGRLRDALAPYRHRRAYCNAHALEVVGVPTARPLAFVRRGTRSYTLLADLSEQERLDGLARRLFASGTRQDQRGLLAASADWLGRLHRLGVYHGDVKGVNVRARAGPSGWTFALIDTDHCRLFDRPLDRRRRIKNLAQLAASIPRAVSRTDRLRWFQRYAASWPEAKGRGEERRIARDVARALAPKILVVDEPIE